MVYALMTDGKTKAEVATFNALLADPADKEKMIARQNMIAQQQLARFGMPPPPPRNGNGNGGEPH